ncbi:MULTISPECIES: competence/damage-inducible protein A [unclassified Candidatus Frackibacter]|uniref:competence/damage-inducible protein A n=1 Tax=unclassified Candidatus Frackibacter TaxID=2648818 RepID=UPI00088C5915|nr:MULTISPECIES: competence/damage-inducible protein A [unclassified Candidatus Frackibacter]SDC50603.1 competence/damage-inducible protein cinA [Candidatus Frackibacter sp. WG11]SEM40410.1 competence/damage-inducible protein cinA [Candidatus Frackibacter sp. WG12]SFL74809.1 competence/damage-inducible protein cinA [Candidatus Frackibacter sp. WG13]
MRAEIVSIGTELLLGQIIDTNAAYIAEKLAELGIDLYHRNTVGDNKERLYKSLKMSLERSDIVLTTGGLGPTDDDLTREVVADVMKVELIKDQDLVERIEGFFKDLGREMTENNLTQAYLPAGAEPIINEQGTAAGIILEKDNNTIISMPGVPEEMKKMMSKTVIPYLKKKLGSNQLIKSKVLKVCGYGESSLETEIKDILDEQTNPTIALLAGKAEVHLRITAKSKDEELADQLIKEAEAKLRSRLGVNIFGVNDETLEEVIGNYLKNEKLTLAVAESCTGGLIGDRITDIPGSSSYFERGVVTYSNQAKKDLLRVKEKTLKEEGAVSKKVALKMAKGVKELASTDLGVSVTGIAGPGGGSKEKPVGLVYMGLATSEGTKAFRFKFHGNRQQIKYLTSQYVLDKLRRYLEGALEL